MKQRFEREARAISSLSHPHICALYDVGSEGGLEYLVMELLEGETLAERLTKGMLPPAQVLRFGVEIAEALGAAHRQGIVHRDLKPGNVMLTKSGVKLLDFGLAKGHEGAVQGVADFSRIQTTPAGTLTGKGVILGTVQYMAPEQLEGKEADSRTDIFALGDVLYEMATGLKAFSKTSYASLIGAILNEEPPAVSTIQTMAPPSLDHIVKKCLAKDPDERWQSAADVASELRWIAQESSQAGAPAAVARRKAAGRIWPTVAAVLAVLCAALAVRSVRRPLADPPVMRFSIAAPEGATLNFMSDQSEEVGGAPALSPDGRWLVFVATDSSSKSLLWLRELDSTVVRPLTGTENASDPFWSADSRSIGFFAIDKLKRLDIAGGGVQVLTTVRNGAGGAWNRGGTIVYSDVGLLHVFSAAGGETRTLAPAARQGVQSVAPSFLPDGRHFLYVSYSTDPKSDRRNDGIFVGDLLSSESTRVSPLTGNCAFASGHILLVSEGRLLALPFDPERRTPAGEPVTVAERVATGVSGRFGVFSVSANGLLVYEPQQAEDRLSRLIWLDRSGSRVGTLGERRRYHEARLSPDGRKVAVSAMDPRNPEILGIWLLDSGGGSEQRLTFHDEDYKPAFSPDGSRLLYSSIVRPTGTDLRIRDLGGMGPDDVVVHDPRFCYVGDWSGDGRSALMTAGALGEKYSIQLLSVGEGKVSPWLVTGSNERDPVFSPDGRWVAYGSDESGAYEIYVRAFSGAGSKWQVSRAAGSQAKWRGDGRELFYLTADGHMMSVETRATAAGFKAGPPKPLFVAPVARPQVFPSAPFCVSADGQRFLVITPTGESGPPPLTVVVNWPAALKR